jgi:hypothetical protein
MPDVDGDARGAARTMAIADIPGPPTPTTCNRRGRERSTRSGKDMTVEATGR